MFALCHVAGAYSALVPCPLYGTKQAYRTRPWPCMAVLRAIGWPVRAALARASGARAVAGGRGLANLVWDFSFIV